MFHVSHNPGCFVKQDFLTIFSPLIKFFAPPCTITCAIPTPICTWLQISASDFHLDCHSSTCGNAGPINGLANHLGHSVIWTSATKSTKSSRWWPIFIQLSKNGYKKNTINVFSEEKWSQFPPFFPPQLGANSNFLENVAILIGEEPWFCKRNPALFRISAVCFRFSSLTTCPLHFDLVE